MLFAIVNANYEFLYVHTGTNGRVSDGGIWSQTGICKRLKENKLTIPNLSTLLDTIDEFPYVFIGDKGISYDEKNFNYRLFRALRVVENVFGTLASRFRVFLQPIAIN